MATKNIVITGASVGIGAAIARCFAKEDYHLVLLARRESKLEALRQELGPGKATIFALDVTVRSEVEETFARIEKDRGAIDILVNNAGGAFGLDRAQEASLDDWEKCINVNIKGLIFCTHCTLPGMVKRRRGHLINMGSVAAHYPYPGGNVYCASKAFVHQFSLNLRADLLGTEVRVSCIEPGLTGGTEFSNVRFGGDAAKASQVYEKTRPLQPEDIAEAVHFCATVPSHVNINTLELMPTVQAFSPLVINRS